ncbi:hypothetical protein MBANPS3_005407 [Mucor bainieri]
MGKRKAADDFHVNTTIQASKDSKAAKTIDSYSFVDTTKIYSMAYLKDSPEETYLKDAFEEEDDVNSEDEGEDYFDFGYDDDSSSGGESSSGDEEMPTSL